MHYFLFEDYSVENFFPLVYFRAIHELRSGCSTLGERIRSHFPQSNWSVICRSAVRPFLQEEREIFSENKYSRELIFVNSRVKMTKELASNIQNEKGEKLLFISDGNVAAAKFNFEQKEFSPKKKRAIRRRTQFSDAKKINVDAKFFFYPWEIIQYNHQAIEDDFRILRKRKPRKFQGVHVVNSVNVSVGKNCTIKPGVVLDAEHGAIVLGDNVAVMANAVIVGPVFIGNNSLIKVGAKIYGGTSIGEWCKVGGEVEASIIQSYSNKQHDGFLGHSFLGSWVNLGADTNTSDLKNNYGNVRVHVGKKEIDSGSQFVGSLIGDHAKTGINVMLNTGTVIGISSNVFGADFPPKFIGNFSWGSGNEFRTYDIQKAIETARVVMKRRNVEMTEEYEKRMRQIFLETTRNKKNRGK
ncbi:MAG: hypothetical protein FJ218_02535 [Ignavibacteria bacterium]|nr:hypothetical protein [Ignavibacteria bacterium]